MRRESREAKTATSTISAESGVLGDSRIARALSAWVLIVGITACGVEPVTPGVARINPAPVVTCDYSCVLSDPSWMEQLVISYAISRISTSTTECANLKEAANMESFKIYGQGADPENWADHHTNYGNFYGDQTHFSDELLWDNENATNIMIHEMKHHDDPSWDHSAANVSALLGRCKLPA